MHNGRFPPKAVIGVLTQRLADLLEHILRQLRRGDDPFQFGAHLARPPRLVTPPAGEFGHHAGRHLRVQRIDLEDHVGNEAVAAAVGTVERPLVDPEMANQGPHPIGVRQREIGMLR